MFHRVKWVANTESPNAKNVGRRMCYIVSSANTVFKRSTVVKLQQQRLLDPKEVESETSLVEPSPSLGGTIHLLFECHLIYRNGKKNLRPFLSKKEFDNAIDMLWRYCHIDCTRSVGERADDQWANLVEYIQEKLKMKPGVYRNWKGEVLVYVHVGVVWEISHG